MSTHTFDASRATKRWTTWLAGAAVAWATFAWPIAPFVIRSAYSDGVFGFLGVLMSGRAQHPVQRYLAAWHDLAMSGLIVLGTLWVAGVIVLRPATWRLIRAVRTRIPTFGGRVSRRTVAVASVLLAVTIAMHSGSSREAWETAKGYEYEGIATSLSRGMGFSFPPYHRWLYLDEEPAAAEYGATAWKEPVYPHLLAGSLKVFGPRLGRSVFVAVQLGLFVSTCLVLYWLGCRLFGPAVGIVAALVTILNPDLHQIFSATLQVHAFSSLLLTMGIWLLCRYAEAPSHRAALGIGVFHGLASLTHAVFIALVPISFLFVLLHGQKGRWKTRVRPALGLVLVAMATVLPWTARNYAQFETLIPVQTGFGLFANVTTPYLVETYEDGFEACGDGSPPEFSASGPADAMRILRVGRNYTRTWQRGVRCVAERHATVYETLNEQERDDLHKAQFAEFVRQHPLRFAQLLATKAYFYLVDVPFHDRGSIPLAALGLIGALGVAGRRRMWVFPVTVLAYSTPFILTAPLYYRYRAPLTPLLTLLAVVMAFRVLERPIRRIRAAWAGADPDWRLRDRAVESEA